MNKCRRKCWPMATHDLHCAGKRYYFHASRCVNRNVRLLAIIIEGAFRVSRKYASQACPRAKGQSQSIERADARRLRNLALASEELVSGGGVSRPDGGWPWCLRKEIRRPTCVKTAILTKFQPGAGRAAEPFARVLKTGGAKAIRPALRRGCCIIHT